MSSRISPGSSKDRQDKNSRGMITPIRISLKLFITSLPSKYSRVEERSKRFEEEGPALNTEALKRVFDAGAQSPHTPNDEEDQPKLVFKYRGAERVLSAKASSPRNPNSERAGIKPALSIEAPSGS
jgi:hypothetical protein